MALVGPSRVLTFSPRYDLGNSRFQSLRVDFKYPSSPEPHALSVSFQAVALTLDEPKSRRGSSPFGIFEQQLDPR